MIGLSVTAVMLIFFEVGRGQELVFIIHVVRGQVGLPDYGPKSAERVLQRIFYVSLKGFFY